MINLHATDELTLQERAELEQQYDGPITEQNIADKIRARGAYAPVEKTAPQLTAIIRWARNDLKFYRGQVQTLEAEIASAMAERDGATYAASELDRKTRHIARMTNQLEDLKAHMRPYVVILEDAEKKLTAMTLQQAAE